MDAIESVGEVGGGSDVSSRPVESPASPAASPAEPAQTRAGDEARLTSEGREATREGADEGSEPVVRGIESWRNRGEQPNGGGEKTPAEDPNASVEEAQRRGQQQDQTLRRGMGMRGQKPNENVRQMQQQLQAAGISPGPLDGKFGPLTEAAVRQFQRRAGLEQVDGIVGPKTLEALRDPARVKAAQSAPQARPTQNTPQAPSAGQNIGDPKAYLKSLNNKHGPSQINGLNDRFAGQAANFFRDLQRAGISPRITAGYERGGHSPNSAHYRGGAIDFTATDRGYSRSRAQIVQQLANRHGLRVIDEYANPGAYTRGGHWDIRSR